MPLYHTDYLPTREERDSLAHCPHVECIMCGDVKRCTRCGWTFRVTDTTADENRALLARFKAAIAANTEPERESCEHCGCDLADDPHVDGCPNDTAVDLPFVREMGDE